MHLRAPSSDHGTISALWAIGFGLFILLGSLAVGVQRGTAFIVAAIAAGGIYIYVRVYGSEDARSR